MRRHILQNLIAGVGILKQAVLSVNSEEHMEVVDLSIKLIDLLGMGGNIFIMKWLHEALTQ